MRTLRRGHRRPFGAVHVVDPRAPLFGLAAWLFISVMAVHELRCSYGIGMPQWPVPLAAFFAISLPSGT